MDSVGKELGSLIWNCIEIGIVIEIRRSSTRFNFRGYCHVTCSNTDDIDFVRFSNYDYIVVVEYEC